MTGLDPTAAASAWIAQIPAAQRAAAEANTAWGETSGLLMLGGVLLVCFALLGSGLLARVRRAVLGRGLSPWVADVACAVLLAVSITLALAPGHILYAARFGPAPGWAAYLLEMLGSAGPLVLLAGLMAPFGLLLIRHLKAWGAICGGVVAVLVFAAVWLPYASASGPVSLPTAPPGPAREALLGLIRDTHVPASEIYVSTYPGIDADVTGTAERARVVVSRGLWTHASPRELRASIGHLMGHYRHGDELSLAILLAALAFLAFLGVQLLAPPLARRLKLDGPGDPAALPLLAALFVVFASLAVVVDHGFIRWINVRADQFSLDNAKEPDGLAQTLLREWKGERVDPSPIEEALFYDHPSLKSRLLHAMSWKAGRGGRAPPVGDRRAGAADNP